MIISQTSAFFLGRISIDIISTISLVMKQWLHKIEILLIYIPYSINTVELTDIKSIQHKCVHFGKFRKWIHVQSRPEKFLTMRSHRHTRKIRKWTESLFQCFFLKQIYFQITSIIYNFRLKKLEEKNENNWK